MSVLCAVFNRVFGTRYWYLSVICFVGLAAGWYYFNHHGHENWALLLARPPQGSANSAQAHLSSDGAVNDLPRVPVVACIPS